MNDPKFEKAFQQRINAINFKASEQEEINKKLKKDFLDSKKSGIYNYLVDIPSINVFYYFFIFIFCFFIINKLNFTLKHIIIIIISGLFVFILNEKRRSTTLTKMQELELKMNNIFPKPRYFYLDAGIVELIHSIREFKNYNVLSFNRLIRTLDDFLGLTLDIKKNPENGFQLYETLKNMKKASLNLLHSIIYNTPSDLVAENKLDTALESLHFILNFHLEKLRKIINENYEENGPNIVNKYIYNEGPDGKDPYFNENYNLF